MKFTRQIHTGLLHPFTGRLRDGLSDYPIYTHQILDQEVFERSLPSDPIPFALISFKLDLSFEDALGMVNDLAEAGEIATHEAASVTGRKLVFGRLRHLLGKVPMKYVLPTQKQYGPKQEYVQFQWLANTIVVLGDTLEIGSGHSKDNFNPALSCRSINAEAIDLDSLDGEIPSHYSVLFVDGFLGR